MVPRAEIMGYGNPGGDRNAEQKKESWVKIK